MATIKPSSVLRNKYNEISDYCNTYNEPVFITRNGKGDVVVLSNTEYDKLCGRRELYRLLDEGLKDVKAGLSYSADDVFANIERKFEFGGL